MPASAAPTSIGAKAEIGLPAQLMAVLQRLHEHFKYPDAQIAEVEQELRCQVRNDDLGQRLMTLPGVDPITASVLAAEMDNGQQFASSRNFAASLGLVPRQYSTGGKTTLLGISKRGTRTSAGCSCNAPGPICCG